MLEKDLENKCCKHAEAHGWKQRKFTSPGRRGVVDRLFLKKSGPEGKPATRPPRLVMVEFKKRNQKPRKLQEKEHAEWMEIGVEVYVVDDFDFFCRKLRLPLVPRRPKKVPTTRNPVDKEEEGMRVLGRHGTG